MIRNLLSMLIEQIEDFSGTVTSVSSADEAEAACDSGRIDLVITDITMPNRSGLDLIRALRKMHPEIQIACLSAYDDYDYIRKALKLGVLDYILKSEMKLEDIISLLEKVESFSAISADTAPTEDEAAQLMENNALIEQYMGDDDSPAEELSARLDCDENSGVIVLAFQLQRQSGGGDDLLKAHQLAEKTREGEQKTGFCVVLEGKRVVMLIRDSSDSIESRENEMMRLSLLYRRNLAEYSSHDIVFSLYETAPSIHFLRAAITKTMDIMDAYGYYSDYKKGSVQLKSLTEEDTPALRQLANDSDGHSDVQAAADRLIRRVETWHQNHMIPREAKSGAICGLFYFMERKQLRSPESLLNYNRYAKRMRYVHDHKSLEKMLHDALDLVISRSTVRNRIQNASVQAAVDYIDANYMQKITLDDIARHIYLNRTYASQIFKKHMRVNFADYLEMVRIDKAKELLADTALPITEIASRVGYSNQSYFTKVFKRSTGLSPNAFRTISKK